MAKVSGTALNELSTEAKGQALTEALTTLSNQNGQAISRRVIELAQIQTPDFVRGSNNAFTVFLYFTGRLPDEASNPDVIAAKQFALASGQVDVMSALLHKLFHQVVVERFELGDQ